MTDTLTETLEALTTGVCDAIMPPPGSRGTIFAALRDAYDLGAMSQTGPEPAPETRDAFGQLTDPEKREGLMVQVVHTIEPEQIAKHGYELSVMAWVQQTFRELHAGGATQDMTIAIVPVGDTLVVTGEGPL